MEIGGWFVLVNVSPGSISPELAATMRKSCAGVVGFSDRPADHQLAGTGINRLGGSHHPGLITHRGAFGTNARGDQYEGFRVLGTQRRGLKW